MLLISRWHVGSLRVTAAGPPSARGGSGGAQPTPSPGLGSSSTPHPARRGLGDPLGSAPGCGQSSRAGSILPQGGTPGLEKCVLEMLPGFAPTAPLSRERFWARKGCSPLAPLASKGPWTPSLPPKCLQAPPVTPQLTLPQGRIRALTQVLVQGIPVSDLLFPDPLPGMRVRPDTRLARGMQGSVAGQGSFSI